MTSTDENEKAKLNEIKNGKLRTFYTKDYGHYKVMHT